MLLQSKCPPSTFSVILFINKKNGNILLDMLKFLGHGLVSSCQSISHLLFNKRFSLVFTRSWRIFSVSSLFLLPQSVIFIHIKEFHGKWMKWKRTKCQINRRATKSFSWTKLLRSNFSFYSFVRFFRFSRFLVINLRDIFLLFDFDFFSLFFFKRQILPNLKALIRIFISWMINKAKHRLHGWQKSSNVATNLKHSEPSFCHRPIFVIKHKSYFTQ